MMDEAIDGCERHGVVREHVAPFTERLLAAMSSEWRP
jgi:hypothetical protein